MIALSLLSKNSFLSNNRLRIPFFRESQSIGEEIKLKSFKSSTTTCLPLSSLRSSPKLPYPIMMNGPSSSTPNVNSNQSQSSNNGNNKIPNSVIGGGVSAGAASTGGVLNSSSSGSGSVSSSVGQQDAMSSLKNIAQEAISRSVGLQGAAPTVGGATVPTSAPSVVQNMMHMSQQIPGSANNNLVASLIQQQQQQQQQLQQERQYGQDVVSMANGNMAQAQSGPVMGSSSSSSTATTTTMANSGGQIGSGGTGTRPGTNVAHIPPLLGVAPLGPSPLQKEHQFQVRRRRKDMKLRGFNGVLCLLSLQFRMMEAAYCHLPTPSDSDKPRAMNLLQRQPRLTPLHYPQVREDTVITAIREIKLLATLCININYVHTYCDWYSI